MWHTDRNKIRTMFHGARALSDQSLLKMMSSPSVKNKRKDYSSSDVDETITKIQKWNISRSKKLCEYVIPWRTLAQKCRNKRDNLAKKSPGSLPVLGEAVDKDLVQWALPMQKQGLPVGREMIIQKNYEINRYMFGSIRSVGSVGWGWCDQFMSRHGELTWRTDQVIKRARNKTSLDGLWRLFCEICQHIMERTIKK